MMKKFIHEKIDLGYEDLTAETTKSGRKYAAPDGNAYPSVTTVLSILSQESIQRWRARVGEEEANKISTRASGRGTRVHLICEKYLDNEEDYAKGFTPDILESFSTMKKCFDTRIDKIYAQEAALYSEHLGLAGRVDCVGVFDGKNSIIDFKTSKKIKKKEWIEGYFIQESAYAIMWEERTGMPITQLVTIISVDGQKEPQVFIEHRDNWTKKLLETINEYRRRKMFGH
jgi:hypothetical protein